MPDQGGAKPIAFKWEWNVNTVAVLMAMVTGFVAWGYTLAEMRNGREQDSQAIARLASDSVAVAARIDLIDRTLSKMDQTEYRLAQLEKAADNVDARIGRINESYSNQFSEFRTQLSAISTQLALTNQTLQRLDVRAEPGRLAPLQ